MSAASEPVEGLVREVEAMADGRRITYYSHALNATAPTMDAAEPDEWDGP